MSEHTTTATTGGVAPGPALPDRVLFGAAWYPEYTPTPRVEADLDLMVAAHVSVVRVGESVWSTWEPEDGRFDLDWLQPALDGAHARGIRVVLGTPTYAVPMWLARRHPEIAAERADGHRIGWGARQEVDYSHPAFRFHAERVVRAVVGRYADHPAVVGFQVDNEPGLELFHNRSVVEAFIDDLRRRYGDVETLNREWGLTYWSHRLSTWADLWAPHGNAQPQYDLAWRRFQSELTTDLIAWQTRVVRELARPDQWVTTCMSLTRRGLDEQQVCRGLDVAAANPYYAMQDGLAHPELAPAAPQGWTTSGTWSLVHTADRVYAAKQAPFLVTETNASAIGGPSSNFPAWDGQWRQVAWAMVARGARMIEYWHWHTLHAGTETYWGGVLPHDQQPGRVYDQLAQLGADLERAGAEVAGLRPDADLGLLYSVPSTWGLAFQPHSSPGVAAGGFGQDEGAYTRLVEVFARGAFDAGLSTRVVHDRQLLGRPDEGDAPAAGTGPETGALAAALDALADPVRLAAELPVLVAAGLYVADDELLRRLTAYAEAGGHLVLGIRTGYADHEARARLEVKPGLLADAAGVSYQEFSNLSDPVGLLPGDGTGGAASSFVLPAGASATTWLDALVVTGPAGGAAGGDGGVEVLARYDHPQFGRWPAATTVRRGRGRVTTVGTLPDPTTAAALLDWAVATTREESAATAAGGPTTTSTTTTSTTTTSTATGSTAAATREGRRWHGSASVTVQSATSPTGGRVHVVHNWSWNATTATTPVAVRDLLAEGSLAAGDPLELGPWDVRVVIEESTP